MTISNGDSSHKYYQVQKDQIVSVSGKESPAHAVHFLQSVNQNLDVLKRNADTNKCVDEVFKSYTDKAQKFDSKWWVKLLNTVRSWLGKESLGHKELAEVNKIYKVIKLKLYTPESMPKVMKEAIDLLDQKSTSAINNLNKENGQLYTKEELHEKNTELVLDLFSGVPKEFHQQIFDAFKGIHIERIYNIIPTYLDVLTRLEGADRAKVLNNLLTYSPNPDHKIGLILLNVIQKKQNLEKNLNFNEVFRDCYNTLDYVKVTKACLDIPEEDFLPIMDQIKVVVESKSIPSYFFNSNKEAILFFKNFKKEEYSNVVKFLQKHAYTLKSICKVQECLPDFVRKLMSMPNEEINKLTYDDGRGLFLKDDILLTAYYKGLKNQAKYSDDNLFVRANIDNKWRATIMAGLEVLKLNQQSEIKARYPSIYTEGTIENSPISSEKLGLKKDSFVDFQNPEFVIVIFIPLPQTIRNQLKHIN